MTTSITRATTIPDTGQLRNAELAHLTELLQDQQTRKLDVIVTPNTARSVDGKLVIDGIRNAGVNVHVDGWDLTDRHVRLRIVAPEAEALAPILLERYRSSGGAAVLRRASPRASHQEPSARRPHRRDPRRSTITSSSIANSDLLHPARWGRGPQERGSSSRR